MSNGSLLERCYLEVHFLGQSLYQIFYALHAWFLCAENNNYMYIHFSSHHAKIVRTAPLLANVDQNILPLDQSGHMEILLSKGSTSPHITVAAFISTLTENKIIRLTSITEKFTYKACVKEVLYVVIEWTLPQFWI